MATITKNPVAGANSPVDGYAGRDATTTETWANKRDLAGDTSNVTDSTDNIGLWASTTSDRWDFMYRTFLLFDTSALTPGATIISAVLSIYTNSKTNGLGSVDLHAVASTPASNSALANSDYQNVGSTSFGSIAYASIPAGGYADITLDANGIANISKTGISKFAIRTGWDITNTPPTWSSGASSIVNYTLSDNGSNKPKLVVTYTLADGGGAFLINFI